MGSCTALAEPPPDGVASPEGDDAFAATGAATVAPVVARVPLPFLVSLIRDSPTVRLGQP